MARNNPSADKYSPTYLIQTLLKPNGVSNPFSFGGGGSGLSDDAADAVSKLWSWEYMGAAEYEFGSCQAALSAMAGYAKSDELIATMVEITAPAPAPAPRGCLYIHQDKKRTVKTAVHVLCHKNHLPYVETVLNGLASGKAVVYPDGPLMRYKFEAMRVSLKRGIPLWENLCDSSFRVQGIHTHLGGLEFDNGWLFAYDEKDFLPICDSFGVAPDGRKFPVFTPVLLFPDDTVTKKIIKAYHAGKRGYNELHDSVYEKMDEYTLVQMKRLIKKLIKEKIIEPFEEKRK